MARIKPEIKKLENLEDVDATLREIGILEQELAKIDLAAAKKIADIKEKAASDGEDKRKRIAELSSMIGAYAQYNKAELFKTARTVELSSGKFGYRKSTTITCRKSCVEMLHKFGMEDYIRLKEEPNKDLMAELDDEQLSMVDAARKVKDEFFCETKKEEVNKDLLKNEKV